MKFGIGGGGGGGGGVKVAFGQSCAHVGHGKVEADGKGMEGTLKKESDRKESSRILIDEIKSGGWLSEAIMPERGFLRNLLFVRLSKSKLSNISFIYFIKHSTLSHILLYH